MSTKRVLFGVLAASLVVLAVGVQAQPSVKEGNPVGLTIPYSGRLADETGQWVADEAYGFRFDLYESELGGQPIWSEAREAVLVQDGTFSVLLGSIEPLNSELLAGGVGWLSVRVRGPGDSGFTTLDPRQRLSAAPPAAPASPSAGPACPHDHWGEAWSGTGPGLSLRSTGGDGPAVKGTHTSRTGVEGIGGNVGVSGTATDTGTEDAYGVFGSSTDGPGVYGTSTAGYGVHGHSEEYGVFGETTGNWGYRSGVFGTASGDHAHGVSGTNHGGGIGVYGSSSNGYAGYFEGIVRVTGNLQKAGGGFKIDHPLEPEDQYLNHSFVESPDMKNVYDGVVVLDERGSAWVGLPNWFEALNKDFRYQLTCIGGFAPVYIAREIQDNRFQIAGGEPGLKVSWQVTGIRHDAYAKTHPLPVEEEKPPDEQGTYLHPVEHGRPETLGLDYQQNRERE